MDSPITFRVDGVPAPKGSTKAFYIARLGRAVVTEDNARTRPWASLVKDAARQATGEAIAYARGCPVVLRVEFVMPRPVSLPKKVTAHTKKPDLDKLARALKDALTGIVWQDDSQVVELVARKRYVTPSERPGAEVCVERADAIVYLMPSRSAVIESLPLLPPQETAHA